MSNLMTRTLVGVVAALVPVVLSGQTDDPLMGARSLDVSKSLFWGGAPIKNLTLIYEPADQGLKATARGVLGDGTALSLGFTAQFDGRFYPVTGSAAWDGIALRRVDRFTVEQTRTKGGKLVGTARVVVSPDGMVLVVTEALADGRPVSVLVYRKL